MCVQVLAALCAQSMLSAECVQVLAGKQGLLSEEEHVRKACLQSLNQVCMHACLQRTRDDPSTRSDPECLSKVPVGGEAPQRLREALMVAVYDDSDDNADLAQAMTPTPT